MIGDVNKVKGVFVDVGAYHPVTFSNTYFFYKCGWTGINIDPRPGCMEAFNKIRPRDKNLEVGIAMQEGTLTYYDLGENSTMNTFSRENLELLGMTKFIQKEIPVSTYRLSTILDKYLDGTVIDLMNIDAEGFDQEILLSNNWEKYRPKIICVELSPVLTLNDVLETETYKFLSEKNYKVYAKNFITKKVSSVIFVDASFS
jgi:FkbM family methyltransferase